jgi:deoxycytidine triphosphate deaminase
MDTPISFAANEPAARSRYSQFVKLDPFPQIESALLSAADIYDYTLQVGMIYPFEPSYLKPATYALTIGGPYIQWEDGKKIEGVLDKGKYITLKKDSILFITLEPLIQLPHYIAARFNLKIDHVYKGLLLGTGPLVDPGFVGKLSIPLHNFTSNDYQIKGGDKFIWMEFTKLSNNSAWSDAAVDLKRLGEPVYFKTRGKERALEDYIYEADKRPIESSIPLSVTKSTNSAKAAENMVKIIMGFNFAIIIGALALVWTVYTQTSTFYNNAKNDVYKYHQELHERDSFQIAVLRNRIDSLTAAIFSTTKNSQQTTTNDNKEFSSTKRRQGAK